MRTIFHRYPWTCTALGVALAVTLAHGASIDQGLFMDDHVHYRSLRDSDWSFRSAVTSTKLGVLGDVLDVWGRREQVLCFFRPIAFWILKAEYTVVGFHPLPMHVFSLGWHFAAAMLVAGLAKQCFGTQGPAALTGMLFALHPAQVAATYWIACQTELMVTVFLLAGFLCYGRFSRWPTPLFARSARWETPEHRAAPDYRWLAASVFFFVLALGCRETGLLLAPLVFIADCLIRPRSLRWIAYAAFALVGVGYLLIRWSAMNGAALPGPPYLMLPSQPGFIRYVLEKFVLYCLGLFAYLPITPAVALDHLRDNVWRFHVPFAGVVAGWIVLLWLLRGRRGVGIPFVWLFLALLPMLPIGSSPHHLYLPSVGMVLILTAALGIGANWLRTHEGPIASSRAVGIHVVIALHLLGFLLGSWGVGWLYRGTFAIEDAAVAQMSAGRRPIRPGDHLFFINLPLGAWYIVPAYESETGLRELTGHALSIAPGLLPQENRSRLVQVDSHTLRLEADEHEYFSGPDGKMVLQMLDLPTDVSAIGSVETDLFEVTVEPGEAGARSMTFRFRRPLTDPAYHFFYGSPHQLAYGIEFEPALGRSVAERGGR